MKIIDAINYFKMHADFNVQQACNCSTICIAAKSKIEQPFKETRKGAVILVMSREADLYVLDEPIGGVDPAARDYILRTHYSKQTRPNSSVLISTPRCGY